MRVEFRFWPANTEVCLVEDLDGWPRVRRSFYTSAKKMGVAPGKTLSGETGRFDAEFYFDFLYEMAPPPILSGSLADYHPYRSEHPEQKARRNAATD